MAEPSKVVHVRNLPSEATEMDVQQLAQSFGPVSRVVLMRAKNQALLEMQDLAAAINLIQFYTGVQPNVKGRNVFVQFSSHKVLTPHEASDRRHPEEGQPNRIVLVTVHNPLYPINVDVLHQVFSPHGFVEKIVTFQKAAGLQALLQYSNQQSAVQAKANLHGRNIYDGCCTLDIQFSNLNELQVNYNNEKTRDYVNQLPDQPGGRNSGGAGAANQSPSIFGGFTGAAVPGAFAQQAAMGMAGFQAVNPLAAQAAAAQFFGGHLPAGVTGTNDRCTLLVTNINNEQVDATKLFHLFSNYGNIIRIKFLHNKPDHALVQLADGLQAELAVLFVKGSTLFGKRLDVNYSKYPTINPSPDASDFSSSNLNRFGRTPKNYRHCCAPTRVLHASGLPSDATAEAVIEHMQPFGPITGSKLIEKDGKKQVLVQFENAEAATDALVSKHGTQIGGSTIRLAFSKTTSL